MIRKENSPIPQEEVIKFYKAIQTNNDDTLLAVYKKYPHIIDAQIPAPNGKTHTPISYAAIYAASDMLACLAALGGNLAQISADGTTILHKIAVLPAREAAQKTEATLAIYKMSLEKQKVPAKEIEKKITSFVNFISEGKEGATALHMAMNQFNFGAAEILLKAGADPNARTREGGGVPLAAMPPKMENRDKIIKGIQLLLQYGADPGIKSNHGGDPFLLYVKGKNSLLNERGLEGCFEPKELEELRKVPSNHFKKGTQSAGRGA